MVKINKHLESFGRDIKEIRSHLHSGNDIYFEIPIRKKKFFKKQIMRILQSEEKRIKRYTFSFLYGFYAFISGYIGCIGNQKLELGLDIYMLCYRDISSIGGEDVDGVARVTYKGRISN